MSYSSRNGRRPNEYASKSSHTNIIGDPKIQLFLDKCALPKNSQDINLDYDTLTFEVDYSLKNPINVVAAIDGGYSEITVKKEFPSSVLNFYQYGVLIFKSEYLDTLSKKPFIDPEDIAKLKEMERYKFVLPTKNVSYDSENIVNSVRRAFYDFFVNDEEPFIESLKWFLFREYDRLKEKEYVLSSCPNPNCECRKLNLALSEMSDDFKFKCHSCNEVIYLTDVFRFHEGINEEHGAGGILAYVTNILEQMLLVHSIKLFLKLKPSLLKETLFLKDGPLAFFGYTANMHKPMRSLCNHLLQNHDLFLVGIEKSGPFVEHAEQISEKIQPGTALLLDNSYIYKYIIPGTANPSNPYARTSYYGGKLIFKSREGKLYVITIPVSDEYVVLNPLKENFKNIDVILNNLEKLKCDMYDNSLFPVALANKLVSLSAHPSSNILEKFAKNSVQ
jgi:hypothetical protein